MFYSPIYPTKCLRYGILNVIKLGKNFSLSTVFLIKSLAILLDLTFQ